MTIPFLSGVITLTQDTSYAAFPTGDVTEVDFQPAPGVTSVTGTFNESAIDNAGLTVVGSPDSQDHLVLNGPGLVTFFNFVNWGPGDTFEHDGTSGDDALLGVNGVTSLLYGGAGNDLFIEGIDPSDGSPVAYNETMSGGAGNDTFFFRAGISGHQDFIYGGAGHDVAWVDFVGDQPTSVFFAGPSGTTYLGGNQMTGVEALNVSTGSGNDTLTFLSGNDTAYAGGGNDNIYGGSGADWLYGGTGNDRIVGYSGNNHLDGGDGNDFLYGGAGIDHMLGGDGNDQLYGGDNNDVLTGGRGADLMTGGDGADRFVFVRADLHEAGGYTTHIDTITDFTQGADLIDLSHAETLVGGVAQISKFTGLMGKFAPGGLESVRYGYDVDGNTVVQIGHLKAAGVGFTDVIDQQIVLTGHIVLTEADFVL